MTIDDDVSLGGQAAAANTRTHVPPFTRGRRELLAVTVCVRTTPVSCIVTWCLGLLQVISINVFQSNIFSDVMHTACGFLYNVKHHMTQ